MRYDTLEKSIKKSCHNGVAECGRKILLQEQLVLCQWLNPTPPQPPLPPTHLPKTPTFLPSLSAIAPMSREQIITDQRSKNLKMKVKTGQIRDRITRKGTYNI